MHEICTLRLQFGLCGMNNDNACRNEMKFIGFIGCNELIGCADRWNSDGLARNQLSERI